MPAAIPATGKPVEIEITYIHRIADDKEVESWGVADFSWIQQLG
jgi:predicted ester cyclase